MKPTDFSMETLDFGINITEQSDFGFSSTERSDLDTRRPVHSDFNINTTELGLAVLDPTTFDLITVDQSIQGISNMPPSFETKANNLVVAPIGIEVQGLIPVTEFGKPVLFQNYNALNFINFLCYFSIALGVISIVVNIINITVVSSRTYKELNKSVLVALSVSNIIFALLELISQLEHLVMAQDYFLALVLAVYYFELGEFFHELTQCCTIYLVVLLVAERFAEITLPRKFNCLTTHVRVILAELFILVLITGFNSRLLLNCGTKLLNGLRKDLDLPYCTSFQRYILMPFRDHLKPFSLIVKFAVPFLVMLAGYIAILIKLSGNSRDLPRRSSVTKATGVHQLRLTKSTMTLFAVISLLVLLPYAVFHVVYNFSDGLKRGSMDQDVVLTKFQGILFNMNSCLSFIILFTMNRKFNGIFKSTFCPCKIF